jgi:pantoate--beta-alanine ligase
MVTIPMLLFKTIPDIQHHLRSLKGSVGLVPTMGALHAGHLSLIEASKKENDITLCSIFVNPLQFNNAADLANYPKTLPSDIQKLEGAGCDILFAPLREELYPSKQDEELDFNIGVLDTLFEGSKRPGHFKGVAVVVNLLSEILKPQRAYFGLKDYQQCMLIKKLVHERRLALELRFEPTLREADGLAMSSRNVNLKPEERAVAHKIYDALVYAKTHYRTENITNIESTCKSMLEETPLYRVEYFNIVNAESLMPLQSKDEPAIALCAAFLGGVRLIDNMRMN